MSALSDSNQIAPCKSSKSLNPEEVIEEEPIDLPDSYDWRKEYPECVQPAQSIGAKGSCSASYAFASLSAMADRICMGSKL